MNFFKTLGAGFAAVGNGIVTKWKDILLGTLAVVICVPIVIILAMLFAKLLYTFVTYMTTVVWFTTFVNEHPVALVCGILGIMPGFAILASIYATGKEKLKKQNDKVSGI